MWAWEGGWDFGGCCRGSFFTVVSGHIWVLILGAFVAEMLISWGSLAAARKQLVSAQLSFFLLS